MTERLEGLSKQIIEKFREGITGLDAPETPEDEERYFQEEIKPLVEQALNQDSPQQALARLGEILGKAVVSMQEGEEIGKEEIEEKKMKAFIPDLTAAGAMVYKITKEILEPFAQEKGAQVVKKGKVVIGTVLGDLHDIGKNLVVNLLLAFGFEVYDIGIDQSAENFVEKVKETNADIVGISALLTTTMAYDIKIIEALEEAGIRDKVKVLVGGAPLNNRNEKSGGLVGDQFVEEIGADAWATDMIQASKVALQLLGKS